MFAEVEVSWPYDPHKYEVYVLTSEKGGPLGQWGEPLSIGQDTGKDARKQGGGGSIDSSSLDPLTNSSCKSRRCKGGDRIRHHRIKKIFLSGLTTHLS